LSSTISDLELKARHRAIWASGDYPSMVETFLLPLGPRLVEACGIGPGMDVLDVAAGTGNASIPAARAGAAVTASDLTPELLDAGRRRAAPAGLALEWVEADAERLPFADESFDVVLSSIGAMFAPDHQDVADELVRVCRPGGTIGLLSWTPEGMIGALFRTMAAFAPPPPGAQPPPLWGSEEHLDELLGGPPSSTSAPRGRSAARNCCSAASSGSRPTTPTPGSFATSSRLPPSQTPARSSTALALA
jgi:SAM-dependent methyltransferase